MEPGEVWLSGTLAGLYAPAYKAPIKLAGYCDGRINWEAKDRMEQQSIATQLSEPSVTH